MCFLKTNVEGSLFKFWWFIVGIEKKNLFEKNIFYFKASYDLYMYYLILPHWI